MKLIMISKAANLAGVHIQTIRVYEQKGIIKPVRSKGGTRLYSEQDVEKLIRIRELGSQGINLSGAQRIIELEAQIQDLEEELDNLNLYKIKAEYHKNKLRRLLPVKITQPNNR